MKIKLLFLCSIVLLMNSCSQGPTGDAENPQATETEEGLDLTNLEKVDIEKAGGEFPLFLLVPTEDYAQGELQVEHNPDLMKTFIQRGKKFHISIAEEDGDVEGFKSQPGYFEDFFNPNFITDTDSLLFYTRENEDAGVPLMYGFYVVVQVGGSTYVIQSEGTEFTKKDCELMIDVVQEIEPKVAS